MLLHCPTVYQLQTLGKKEKAAGKRMGSPSKSAALCYTCTQANTYNLRAHTDTKTNKQIITQYNNMAEENSCHHKIHTVSIPTCPNRDICIKSDPLTAQDTFSQYYDRLSLFRAQCILLTCRVTTSLQNLSIHYYFLELNVYSEYMGKNPNTIVRNDR